MSSVIHATGHGLVADDPFRFANIVPDDTGVADDVTYYVLAAGLTADDFHFALTPGGAAITLLLPIESVDIMASTDYVVNGDVMSPPTLPPAPNPPVMTSAQVSGIVRLRVALDLTGLEPKVRVWEVQITSKFSGADPEWSTPLTHTLPEGSVDLSVPALGSTNYAARVRMVDVYGNESDYSDHTEHVTVEGSDAVNAALAGQANDITFQITETQITPGAITSPLIAAGAVTAEALAAEIILASLLKTANTGRRIELDIAGIRLYDETDGLLVNIPTNGDPVYVKGQVNADSLISQTAASFRTAASLEGSAIMTLQNGVSAPANPPTVSASVDVLALASAPVSPVAGIAYDSGAGSFWIAADPASGYVAHEYHAGFGTKIRSIPATGSTTTVTATLGSTSHVTDGANGRDGSTDSHFATPLTIPAGLDNVHITKIAAYFAGHSGSCVARVVVWDDVSGTGNALGYSAEFTASSGGATAVGASDLYNKTLASPVPVTAGSTYWFGVYHKNSGEGFQWDFDSGASKSTYLGDGTGSVDGTGWALFSSSQKPNVSATYTYDVDTRLETLPMIGVATDGTYVYTLDTSGVIWKYDRTTMAYVSKSSVQTAITGDKSLAGMFYDATANELIITTFTGTGAGVYPKFVRVTPATLAVSASVYSAAAGTSFTGSTAYARGGARVADALNAGAATYWVPINGQVYAYTFAGSVATLVANREFGTVTTVKDGLTYDGSSRFRGWAIATPTQVWKFSTWDFTTASTTLWVAYSWYDAAGTTHETAMGPRTSVVVRRHERLQVVTPAIPTGGVDDPNQVRIYTLQNATDTGAGTFWLQVTDALTSRYLTSYTASGTHDGAGTPFAAGTPAELKSSATGWSFKGDGTMIVGSVSRQADSSRFDPVGEIAYAYGGEMSGYEATTTSTTLAANGGSVAIPVRLDTPMFLQSVSIRNNDVASARSWNWSLWTAQGTATGTRIAVGTAADAFTAGAASNRTIAAASAPVLLRPGLYWIVIQCQHATNNFLIGGPAAGNLSAIDAAQTKTLTNPLSTTLDFTAATWTKVTTAPIVRLNGRVFGQAVAF